MHHSGGIQEVTCHGRVFKQYIVWRRTFQSRYRSGVKSYNYNSLPELGSSAEGGSSRGASGAGVSGAGVSDAGR